MATQDPAHRTHPSDDRMEQLEPACDYRAHKIDTEYGYIYCICLVPPGQLADDFICTLSSAKCDITHQLNTKSSGAKERLLTLLHVFAHVRLCEMQSEIARRQQLNLPSARSAFLESCLKSRGM